MIILAVIISCFMGGFLSMVLNPGIDLDIAFCGGALIVAFICLAMYIALRIFK